MRPWEGLEWTDHSLGRARSLVSGMNAASNSFPMLGANATHHNQTFRRLGRAHFGEWWPAMGQIGRNGAIRPHFEGFYTNLAQSTWRHATQRDTMAAGTIHCSQIKAAKSKQALSLHSTMRLHDVATRVRCKSGRSLDVERMLEA